MIGIKDNKLIIDYTPDEKRALSILKKFTGGKHRKEFQNKFFLTEGSDGSYFTFPDATHAVCCKDGCCTYFLMPLLTE